jgi:DNA polymerase
LFNLVADARVIKKAWNVYFEFEVTKKLIGDNLQFINWQCVMAKSAYNGYPLGLDAAGKALKLKFGKLDTGKELVKYFCNPCKPTKANGMRTRNLPEHAPEKWEEFKAYNVRDVLVEYKIDKKFIDLPAREQKIFALDYKINSAGVRIDSPFVWSTMMHNGTYSEWVRKKLIKITGLQNPNSGPQLKQWLFEIEGKAFPSLSADKLPEIIKSCKTIEAKTVLALKKELGLTSVKKFNKMPTVADEYTDMIKGGIQYYGAMRTGRFAGRAVQVHNLSRPKEKPEAIAEARAFIKSGATTKQLQLVYGSVLQLSKELLRTAFVPRKGFKFLIADYSAIEAVVIAELAQEKWRLDIFKGHGKIYEESISRMLKIPMEQVTEELRQKGKVSELALGFGGGVGALMRMGAEKMGLSETECEGLKIAWREASPNIVQFWRAAERAAREALENPGSLIRFCRGLLGFIKHRDCLELQLPARRSLFYPGAYKDDTGAIYYFGLEQGKRMWGRHSLYGGKIVENIVQATARDILTESMLRIDQNLNFNIPLHVHDELVIEVPEKKAEHFKVLIDAIMVKPPEWLPNIPLKTKSFISDFYCKG